MVAVSTVPSLTASPLSSAELTCVSVKPKPDRSETSVPVTLLVPETVALPSAAALLLFVNVGLATAPESVPASGSKSE